MCTVHNESMDSIAAYGITLDASRQMCFSFNIGLASATKVPEATSSVLTTVLSSNILLHWKAQLLDL